MKIFTQKLPVFLTAFISLLLLSCSFTSFLAPKPAVTITPIDFPESSYDVGSTIISPKDKMNLVFVPAGEFSMGSDDGDVNEQPVHTVHLDSFWIDQTEVTNSMYSLCVNNNACQKPFETTMYDDTDFVDSPVDYVTWENANDYCTWAGRRLPTEAEWEKAAGWDGANNKKRIYPWGDTLSCSFANVYIEDSSESGCEGYPIKTGSYPLGASYYGAFDMAGNVIEWVADWYDESYYQASPHLNPKGPANGKYHVLRGSSFIFDATNTTRQSESFFNNWPTFYDNVGFRCAADPSE